MSEKKKFPSKTDVTGTHTNSAISNITDATQVVELKDSILTSSGAKLLPLIQITAGPDQGKILSIPPGKKFIIGRSRDVDLTLHDPSCSRQHAEIFPGVDDAIYIKDLGSLNGTKINGETIKEATALKDGDRIQLADNVTLRFILTPESDAKVQLDMYLRATRDPLTNAFNRRSFNESLTRELAVQLRHGDKGLGLIMLDVDHFKRINDSFGHLAGDEVLKSIGHRIHTLIRKEDLFARLGGEEFAVLTRHDGFEGLKALSDRIRETMRNTPVVFEGRNIPFTVSLGITFLEGKNSVAEDRLVQIADEALYEAKNTGRDRVVYKAVS